MDELSLAFFIIVVLFMVGAVWGMLNDKTLPPPLDEYEDEYDPEYKQKDKKVI